MAYRARSSQSYARDRRRGFNPPILPDVSEKMLREGERTIRSKADAFQAEIDNRNQILNRKKENRQLERRSEAEAFDFAMEVEHLHGEAELQHYKTAINDVKVRQAEWERNKETRDAIVEMVPKAIQAYGQFNQAREEAIERETKRIYATAGLSKEDWDHWLFTVRKTGEVEEKAKGWINSKNLSTEQTKYLQNISGRRLLNIQRYHVRNTGTAQVLNKIASDPTRVFDLGDNTSGTLESVLNNGDPSQLSQIKKTFQTELINDTFGDKASVLLKQELSEQINKTFADFEKTVASNDRNRTYKEAAEGDLLEALVAITNQDLGNIGEGLKTSLNIMAGGDRELIAEQKDKLINAAVAAAKVENGAFTRERWENLRNSSININGNEVPFETFFSNQDIAGIERSFVERENAAYEARQEKLKAYNGAALGNWSNRVATQGLQTEEQKAIYAHQTWTSKGLPIPDGWKSYASIEQVQETFEEAELTGLYQSENGITWQSLTSGRYSKRAIDKWGKSSVNGPESLDEKYRKGSLFAFGQKIKGHAGNLVSDDNITGQVKDIITESEKRIKDNYRLNIGKFPTNKDAWDHAVETEEDLLNADKDIYELLKHPDGKLKFVGGGFKRLKQNVNPNLRADEYLDKARTEPERFLYDGTLHDDDLRALEMMRLGGEMPGFLGNLDVAYPNLSPHEIANIFLDRAGKKPIQAPGMAGLAPWLPQEGGIKRMVTNKPNLSKTERCLSKFPQGKDKPLILKACQSKKAVNKSEKDPYAYYEVNGVQTELPNAFTAEAYVNLGRDNPDDQAELGAYLFNFSDILNAINKGWVSPNELLGEEQLDRIQLESIYDRTGKFHVNGQEIPGVGHSWLPTKANKALKFDFGDEFDQAKLIPLFGGV